MDIVCKKCGSHRVYVQPRFFSKSTVEVTCGNCGQVCVGWWINKRLGIDAERFLFTESTESTGPTTTSTDD